MQHKTLDLRHRNRSTSFPPSRAYILCNLPYPLYIEQERYHFILRLCVCIIYVRTLWDRSLVGYHDLASQNVFLRSSPTSTFHASKSRQHLPPLTITITIFKPNTLFATRYIIQTIPTHDHSYSILNATITSTRLANSTTESTKENIGNMAQHIHRDIPRIDIAPFACTCNSSCVLQR